MSAVARTLVTIALLGCAHGAMAREFPIELVKPYYSAIVKACSAKDPANATHYRAGFKRMLAEHPEAATAVVDKKDFPNLKQQIEKEMAEMPEKTLLRECNNLYEIAGEGQTVPASPAQR
jgi:hypothetical protein